MHKRLCTNNQLSRTRWKRCSSSETLKSRHAEARRSFVRTDMNGDCAAGRGFRACFPSAVVVGGSAAVYVMPSNTLREAHSRPTFLSYAQSSKGNRNSRASPAPRRAGFLPAFQEPMSLGPMSLRPMSLRPMSLRPMSLRPFSSFVFLTFPFVSFDSLVSFAFGVPRFFRFFSFFCLRRS